MSRGNTSMSSRIINIGVYGCTKAGKTRFLFQLLNYWKNNNHAVDLSEAGQKFLHRVQSEIEKGGGSAPTVATTEDIRVNVRRNAKDPPWELIFRDLRGELLSEQIDNIDSLERKNVVPTQVRQCNAFLFFFDPASSERPAEIDEHHERELKRVEKFIKYVLKTRQNRHLPIIFVLTHLDEWEDNEEVRRKAEQWIKKVHFGLKELYDEKLRGQYPKGLVDESRVFFRVSSVGQTPQADKDLDKVIGQLTKLFTEAESFQRNLQSSGLGYLLSAFGVILTLLVLLYFIANFGRLRWPRNGVSESAVSAKLDQLARLLEVHPPGTQLPSVEDAEKLNTYLRWLVQLSEPQSGLTDGLSEETKGRIGSNLEAVAKLVKEKACSDSSSNDQRAQVLAAYLADLPDLSSISPELAGVQQCYWEVEQERVVEEVGGILRKRQAAGSDPIDTLDEVVNTLKDIEREVKDSRVFDLQQARQKLLSEIQTAETFCEDRIKHKTYEVAFQITGSFNERDGKWRNLRIESPGQDNETFFKNGIALRPTVNGGQTTFSTNQSEYRVSLGLGRPVKLVLSVYESQRSDWSEVTEFDITNPENSGSLQALGLPLHKRDKVTVRLQSKGYDFQITLNDFSPVPELLWRAAEMSNKEQRL